MKRAYFKSIIGNWNNEYHVTDVEQLDVHSPHATVREALNFSAILRQPYGRYSGGHRRAFVEQMLRLIELEEIGDKVIGENSEDGLSMGERKRVTIGVELVANPSVLFLGKYID